MRTPSGILHVVDFKTEQIVANIQPKDYWDDKRHWEIKNNIDTLEFKVFDNTEHAATLMQQNLVLKEVRDGRIVPYVITEAEEDSDDRSVITYASGEWVQLAKAGIINPQKLEGKTVNELVDMALAGTKWKRGKTEYAGFHSMTIDEFIDPLKFLKDIASLFELEIQYRAEVVGSQIVGRYVDMIKKRGQETGKEVTLGKDLMGVKRVENSQNICTALIGFVKKEGEGFITIADINNGIPFIVDTDSFQRWNEKGQHKYGFYTPETEEDITPQRLMALMKTELKKRVNTSVSYEVNAQSIGRVFGLAHELINEGDTIRIKDTGFTPKLYLEARAIAADESFTDPTQDKYVFGDYREIIDPNEELRKLYNKILASLGNKQEILDQLDKLIKEANDTANNAQKESEAAKTLAEKVLENVENNTVDIIESVNPPTANLKPNKTLWRDISKGKPGILKIWTGMEWEELVPDYGDDVKELDERTANFETSIDGINSDVKQLSITTTEQGKQILDANSKIEQNAQDIEAKVNIKQVEDYVGGIGNINWLRNTELRNDTKYWNLNDPLSTVRDVENKYKGSVSFKTVSLDNTSDVFKGAEQATTDISVGDTVVASAYFKTDNPTALDQGGALEIQFLKIDGTIIKQVSEEINLLKNQWTRFTISGLAPEGTVKAKFRYYIRRNGTLWMAKPMFQLGSIPSSYLENPNDFVDKDKIIEDLADKIATADYNKKVTEYDNKFTITQEGLDLSAKKTEVYTKEQADGEFAKDAYVKNMESRIQVTENGIKNTVQKGTVISEINQTSEAFKIKAGKIELDGNTVANSLQAQELVGVTMKTAPNGQQRYVKLNQQNIELYDRDNVRAEFRFFNRSDGTAINPSITLGRSVSGGIVGALNIAQWTPINAQGVDNYQNAQATIGMVEQYNPITNEFTYGSRINFFQNGQMAIKSTNSHNYSNNNGSFTFENTGKTTGNQMMLSDNNIDADLRLAYIRIRASHATGYQSYLQLVPTGENTPTAGLQLGNLSYTSLTNRSSRSIKSNIRDLEIDSLEKIMSLKVQQYNFKSDVEKLYKMRKEAVGTTQVFTTRDIPLQYGLVLEDTDETFVSDLKDGINLYTLVTLNVDATQKIKLTQDDHAARIAQLEEELETQKLREVDQEKRITALEELVQKLINEK